VTIDIDENPSKGANALLQSPEAREGFARAWMEACRRADGEAPAQAKGFPGQDKASRGITGRIRQ